MTKKEYGKYYYEAFPWRTTLYRIRGRCGDKNNRYHKKGIKNFLTAEDLKFLWHRDRAFEMKSPSIDRKDPSGNYTLENCQYMEFSENVRKGDRTYCSSPVNQLTLDGKFIRRYDSINKASIQVKKNMTLIRAAALRKNGTSGGFRWEFASKERSRV